MAVGVEALGLGLVDQRAGDRRVLGAAVGAERLDAEPRRPLGDGGGHRRAAEAGEGHAGEVLLGEVGVVEDAGEEERGAAAHADVLGEHQPEDLAGIPHVDHVHRVVAEQRHHEGVEHPDEVAHRRAGDGGRSAPREHVVELARLAGDRAVRVDHALRVLGGARGERDRAPGRRGRPAAGPSIGSPSSSVGERRGAAGERVGGGVADDQPARPGTVGRARPPTTARWSVSPKRSAVMTTAGSVASRMYDDLLGAVEVHDRDHDRAEVGGAPRTRCRPPPSSAAGARRRRRARRRGRPGEPANERAARSTSAMVPDHGRTFDRTWNSVAPRWPRPSATIEPEGAVVPPPLGPVLLRQLVSRRAGASTQPSIPLSRRSVATPPDPAATAVVEIGEWDYHPRRW